MVMSELYAVSRARARYTNIYLFILAFGLSYTPYLYNALSYACYLPKHITGLSLPGYLNNLGH